jgi:hypothetical protein
VRVQAALLDLKVARIVGRVLVAMFPATASNKGGLGGSVLTPEAFAVVTQLMEVVMVLFTPDVCLNPSLPPEQRVAEETPSVAEVCLAAASMRLERVELRGWWDILRLPCCCLA